MPQIIRPFRLLIPFLLLTHALTGHASMVLDRSILTFSADGPPRQDVSVANPDNENLYIEVSVLEVLNPGTDEETREVVDNPESIGLIAAPRLLMVPPGGRRNIRLVNLNGHGDTEKVYRVNVTPTPPPIEATTSGIRVLIAYQLLIFVEPIEPREELVAVRNGRILQLTNNGNVNISLTGGQQCSNLNRESCTEVAGKRLYPGNSIQLELPEESGPVFFEVKSRENSEIREF